MGRHESSPFVGTPSVVAFANVIARRRWGALVETAILSMVFVPGMFSDDSLQQQSPANWDVCSFIGKALMPELPEVETTLRAIRPSLEGKAVRDVVVRSRKLRWPIPRQLNRVLSGQRIESLERRAKYLLLHVPTGTLIIHLGMSGSLRIAHLSDSPGPYDHFELVFAGGRCLRFRDPRRFGAVLWTTKPVQQHPLLAKLGPEPLGEQFDGEYLYDMSRGRRVAIKSFLMNGRIVVGVGNIYASESLYAGAIHPARAAGRISRSRYEQLADAVREVLTRAIQAGGTTLRDFQSGDGQPGYFRVSLAVYGREGQPCKACGASIRRVVMAQRSTYYCPGCQH